LSLDRQELNDLEALGISDPSDPEARSALDQLKWFNNQNVLSQILEVTEIETVEMESTLASRTLNDHLEVIGRLQGGTMRLEDGSLSSPFRGWYETFCTFNATSRIRAYSPKAIERGDHPYWEALSEEATTNAEEDERDGCDAADVESVAVDVTLDSTSSTVIEAVESAPPMEFVLEPLTSEEVPAFEKASPKKRGIAGRSMRHHAAAVAIIQHLLKDDPDRDLERLWRRFRALALVHGDEKYGIKYAEECVEYRDDPRSGVSPPLTVHYRLSNGNPKSSEYGKEALRYTLSKHFS